MPVLEYDPQQFSLDDTLACGQAFRWERLPDGAWRGVVRDAVITLRQEGARLHYNRDDGRGRAAAARPVSVG
jgi:N-glycosylase/DNA lyase